MHDSKTQVTELVLVVDFLGGKKQKSSLPFWPHTDVVHWNAVAVTQKSSATVSRGTEDRDGRYSLNGYWLKKIKDLQKWVNLVGVQVVCGETGQPQQHVFCAFHPNPTEYSTLYFIFFMFNCQNKNVLLDIKIFPGATCMGQEFL